MSLHSPKEIAALAIQAGVNKSRASLANLLILGFLAGAFIATGFLLDIHVIGTLPAEWGSFGALLGAAVFPIGLILTILAGGELLTGNMMTLPIAWFARQISLLAVVRNWFWVTLANFAGSLAVAYFFGHLLGLTEGAFLHKTLSIAQAKVDADFLHAFISGVGCNSVGVPGGVAGLCQQGCAGQSDWHVVPGDGVCRHRLPARGGEHVYYPGGHFCRWFKLEPIPAQFHGRVSR